MSYGMQCCESGSGKKDFKKSQLYFFFSFWSSKFKTLDPDPDHIRIGFSESGSTTLVIGMVERSCRTAVGAQYPCFAAWVYPVYNPFF
jgi:hypothetical protein